MGIRVVIADDHPIVRVGVRGVFERLTEIELVGEALTGDEALHLTEELHPDVLILDVNMPGIKATKVLRMLKHRALSTRVLVLTSYSDSGNRTRPIQGGRYGVHFEGRRTNPTCQRCANCSFRKAVVQSVSTRNLKRS